MNNNAKSGILNRLKLRLLVVFLLIGAVICAVFGINTAKPARASTSSNVSQFTQVNGGNEMFNDYYNIFSVTALDDLVKKIYGNPAYMGQTKKASEFTTKNLMVKIGGLSWTPVYASTVDGDAYVTFWLADCMGTSTYGNQDYISSDIRKHLTGLGTSTVSQSSTWYGFINKFSPYIKSGTLGSYRDESNGKSDYLWLPTVDFIGNVGVNYDKNTGALKGAFDFGDGVGKFGTSVIQQTCTANGYNGYWLQVRNRQTSGDFPTGSTSNVTKNWIYGMSPNGTTPLSTDSANITSGAMNLRSRSYGVRPCFSLNITKAYSGLKQDSVVHPQVTISGSVLYTSSKMPTITTTSGDTAGTIAWVDTTLEAGVSKYQWKFTPTSSSYTTVTGWYTLTALAVQFDTIKYEFDPGTNNVYTTTPLDTIKDYLTVTAVNNDKSTGGTISKSDYQLYGELVAGTNTLKLVYGGKAFDVRITGVQSSGVITYDSLEISSQPNVLTYKAYEKFNQTGMKVKAVYSNGTKKEVTDYVIEYPDYDGNPSNCFHYGDTQATVKYTVDGVTQSTTVAVTVERASSKITPQVTVTGTLYTSSNLPAIAKSTGDTAGVIEWDKVDDGNGNKVFPSLTAGTNGYTWTFKPTDPNMAEVTGTYYLTAEQVKLDRIVVTYDPEVEIDPATGNPVLDPVTGNPVLAKIYTSYDIEDITEVTVIGYNNDGSLYTQFDPDGEIPAGEYSLSGKLTAGNSTITVTYGGKVATFTVEGVIKSEIASIKASYPATANSTGVMTVYASYKAEQLKENLTVTVIYNDGTEKALTSSDYYEVENHLSDTNPYIKVIYGDKEFTYRNIHNLGTARFDRITVEFKPENNLIYETIDPDKINELKKFITVKRVMTDGEEIELEDGEYRLTGTLSASNPNNELTITYTPAGSANSVTTNVAIPDVEADKLLRIELIEYTRPTDGLTTGTPLTALLDKAAGTSAFKLRAVYATTSKTISNINALTLTGELKAGTDCYLVVTYSDGTYEASLRVNVGEVTLVKKKPVVSPKIDMTGAVLVDGEKLPQISLSTGDTPGTIVWEKVDDGNGNQVDATLKTGSFTYKWKFVPAQSVENDYEGAEGVYPITAVAKKVVSLEIELRTGATVYPTTSASDLKDRFIVTAVYNYTDGNGNIYKERGIDPADYEIYFNLVANLDCTVNFRYTDANGNFVLGEKQIRVEQPGDTIRVDTRWDDETLSFVFNGKAQKPTAYFTVTQDNQEVKILLEVAVYKVENGVEVPVSAIDKGVYRVKAVTPASGKYTLIGQTIRDFEITAKKITRPTAMSSSYVYTGNEQEFLFNGFDANIMTVTGNKQTEAGKHEVTVSLTDGNYEFEGVTGANLTFVFDILPDTTSSSEPAPVVPPNVTVEGNGISTGLAIAIGVAVLLVLIIAVTAIIIALKNKGT
ncbi:MAG: hypothetical protein HDQ88_00385, partial [Clostridia bacterium]|nr:hypothetical protein [Clostridia bacterium]